MLKINLTDPRSAEAALLITELSAEIAALYPDEGGDGRFSPDDVLVPGGAFVVAWMDDRPVGCGALKPFGEQGVGEIKRMYVIPELRGQHLAEHILINLEDQARAYGYFALRLETGTLQPAAIRLYERMGYYRIDCYGPYEGEELSVCFEKIL